MVVFFFSCLFLEQTLVFAEEKLVMENVDIRLHFLSKSSCEFNNSDLSQISTSVQASMY